jgi:hypothetical protein
MTKVVRSSISHQKLARLQKEDITKTIKALIKRHPLLSYFALTFAITWGGFVLAVGPGGIPATKEQFTTIPLGAILAVLVGPSVSGILLTGLVHLQDRL